MASTAQPGGTDSSASAMPIASEASRSDRLEALYPDDAPKADPEASDSAASEPAKPTAEGKDAKDSDGQQETAEYKVQLPEGMELDRGLLTEATPVLREIGLADHQVSKLLPLVGKVQERMLQQQGDDFTALRTEWASQSTSDREMGGSRWSETMRLADIAMNAGGATKGSEFRQLLDESGLGNHPAFVRVFRKLGQQLAAGKGSRAAKPDRLAVLYPDD